ASAIVPLVGATEGLQAAVDAFPTLYANAWGEMLAHKLGWERFEPDVDGPLAEELFTMLQATETDMTVFFRRLASTEDAEGAALDDAYYGEASEDARGARSAWLTKYLARADGLGLERAVRAERMNRANPKYVLRNYLAQVAIDAAEKGDGGEVNELLETLRRPYDEQPGRERHAEKRPDWARHRPGCSMLSCSS
ncbi:MAG: protein adenylyltransferase SelO family protein, partial [Planctomycetota bacterium]